MVNRQKNLNEKVQSLQKALNEKLEVLDIKTMTVEEKIKMLETDKKRVK